MSNYSKTTDFAAKDSLPSGDSGKIIRGSEFETEFDNISTAIATKADAASPTFTGTVTIDGLTVNGNTVLGNAATDTVTVTADIASNLLPSADDTYNLGASGAEWNDLFIDGTANIDSLVAGSGSFTSISTTGNVTFGDNDKALFGAGSDLQIYHDGSNSRIQDAGTGNLLIRANAAVQLENTNGDNMLFANAGGSVDLYYNASKKLETTSTGIDVTGTIVGDGLTSDGSVAINSSATSGNTTNQLTLRGGTGNVVSGNVVGGINFDSFDLGNQNTSASISAIASGSHVSGSTLDTDLNFKTADGSSPVSRLNIAANGDISFYEDTGTTPKLFWDASAESLGIGTNSPATALDVNGDITVNNLNVDFKTSIGGTTPRIEFIESDTTDLNARIRNTSGIFQIQSTTDDLATNKLRLAIDHSDGEFALYNTAGSVKKLVWDATNLNLGINTTSPTARVHSVSSDSTPSFLADGGFGDFSVPDGQAMQFGHWDGSSTITERMRIDTSGNVGIGTSSPSQKLHVYDGTTVTSSSNIDVANFQSQTAGVGGAGFKSGIRLQHTADTDKAVRITAIQSADYSNTMAMGFEVSNAGSTPPYEAMRITSGGHLLVGKTSQDSITTVGFEAKDTGQVVATTSSTQSLILNRTTSDGTIAEFRKNNTAVGEIGVYAGDLLIGLSDHKLRFFDDNNAISPCVDNGTVNDAVIDLGVSNSRFKDLYLSGGAYLGGTAAANKLDDYEEGTFTPAFSGGDYTFTYNKQKGSYTKIGNRVFVDMMLNIDTSTAPSGTTDGDLSVTGLPFTFNAQNSVDVLAVSIGFKQQIANAEDSLSVRFASGNTEFKIHKDLSTGFPDSSLLQASDLVANSRLRIQFSYPTNS